MNTKLFEPKKLPPYDLLLVPILVLLCFYAVTFQLENSDVSMLLSSDESDLPTITIDVADQDTTNYMVKREITRAPLYPRAARISLAFHSSGMAIGGNVSFESGNVSTRNTETYQDLDYNVINLTSEKSVSTFSVDVDTGGFSNIRRMLTAGRLPETNQVRTEEIINYFSYDYPKPVSKEKPFTITTGLTKSPWNKNSHLLHIGLKGYEENVESLPNSNLVFLVDISGSMQHESKLLLVKKSLKLLTKNLRDDDRISIVTYAGATQVILSSTRGSNKNLINMTIDQLGAGGSTAGESGLRLAYQQAQQGFIQAGNNRILLMTDGDFNVGLSGVDEMVRLVERKRKSGVYLSTIGFGAGNYREDLMEQMADHGNGIYFYIDSYAEAYRVFERNLRSNLFAIAKDVKIQVEFNPAQVSEYRLVGYENRLLNKADFNNDKVDAGDVGQGHSVTAIYEVTLTRNAGKIDQNRYVPQANIQGENLSHSKELAFIKLRYKSIGSDESKLMTKTVSMDVSSYQNISQDFKTAILAASFGELLRDSQYVGKEFNFTQLLKMLESFEYKKTADLYELENLIILARSSY